RTRFGVPVSGSRCSDPDIFASLLTAASAMLSACSAASTNLSLACCNCIACSTAIPPRKPASSRLSCASSSRMPSAGASTCPGRAAPGATAGLLARSGIRCAARIVRRGAPPRPAAEQPLELRELATNPDALSVDVVLAQILRVVARTHLDDRQHPLELAVHFDVTLHDDRVGQECGAVGTEPEVQVPVLEFGSHQ